MRKLGTALGVEAMSLYHHVANKDDLLNGMVDAVFAKIELSRATPTGEPPCAGERFPSGRHSGATPGQSA